MTRLSLLLKALFFFAPPLSFAASETKFRAPYVEFKIDYNWDCRNFGAHWACYHSFKKGDRPTFILVTAKEANSSDNTNLYVQFFNKQQISSAKKIHTKKIIVNAHVWAESFYKGHLLKDIFNRYAATVCCDNIPSKIHILIGFHAPKEHYTQYAMEFLRAIKSLRLADDLKEALSLIRKQTDKQTADMLSYIEKILLEAEEERVAGPSASKQWPLSPWLWLAGLALAVAAMGFVIRKKTKRARKKKRRKKR